MWGALAFGVVLVAFVGLQIVDGLSCYTCYSPIACSSPTVETCDERTANTTIRWLNTIHSDVPAVRINSYKCMNLTYFTSSPLMRHEEFLGCIYDNIMFCSLTLNRTHLPKTCKSCNYDLCNRNPAGTFSGSSLAILASALALIAAKKLI